MHIYLNITTEDGELLDKVEVEVKPDDPLYPIGRGLTRAGILLDIEVAARTVLARVANAS